MTIVVIVFLPLVLAYQAWTYYVFRRRVSAAEFQPQAPLREPATVGTPSPSPDGAQSPASGPV
jgi:cytochrome d ubiquinol oxidase subunit II